MAKNMYGGKKCGKRRSMKGGKTRKSRKMKGGSVLANALPSLVLYGLSKTFRNSNTNSNKTRKNRRGRGRGRKSRRM